MLGDDKRLFPRASIPRLSTRVLARAGAKATTGLADLVSKEANDVPFEAEATRFLACDLDLKGLVTKHLEKSPKPLCDSKACVSRSWAIHAQTKLSRIASSLQMDTGKNIAFGKTRSY